MSYGRAIFFVIRRQFFAGILYVLQEKLTKYGGKRTVQTAFWRLSNRPNVKLGIFAFENCIRRTVQQVYSIKTYFYFYNLLKRFFYSYRTYRFSSIFMSLGRGFFRCCITYCNNCYWLYVFWNIKLIFNYIRIKISKPTSA